MAKALHIVLVALGCLLMPRLGWCADRAREARCSTLWALEELGQLREELLETCRRDPRSWKDPDFERIRRALSLTAALDDASVVLLIRAFGLGRDMRGFRSQAALYDLSPKLTEERCKDFLDEIHEFLDDSARAEGKPGKVFGPSRLRQTWMAGCASACLDDRDWRGERSDRRLLAVLVPPDTTVTFLEASPGSQPHVEELHPVRLGMRTPLAMATGSVDLYLLAAPRHDYFAIIAESERETGNDRGPGGLTRPDSTENAVEVLRPNGGAEVLYTLRLGQPRSRCLGLDLALPAGAAVLLDGQLLSVEAGVGTTRDADPANPVYRQRFAVTAARHKVTILGPENEPGRRNILANETRAAKDLAPGSCTLVKLDLTTHEHVVGLLGADTGVGCPQVGLDALRIRKRIAEYLESHQWEVRDLHGAAEATNLFQSLLSSAASLGTGAVGSPRARLDNAQSMGETAVELFRKGLQSLLYVRVECSGSGAASAISISARLVDLQEIHEQQRDDLTGSAVQNAIRSEVETLERPDQVRDGVVAPIARLLEIPYVHFSSSSRTASYFRDLPLKLDGHVSWSDDPESGHRHSSRVIVESWRLRRAKTHDDPCSAVSTANALGGEMPSGLPEPYTVQEVPINLRGSFRLDVQVPPSSLEAFLVRARVQVGAGSEAATEADSSYLCVRTTALPYEVFVAGLEGGASIYQPTRYEQLEKYSYRSAFVSFGRPTSLSFVLGMMYKRRRILAPPSFEDLDAGGYDTSGRMPFDIDEYGVLAGPGLTTRVAPLCGWFGACGEGSRRLEAILRAQFVLKISTLNVNGVPAGLEDYLGEGTARQPGGIGWDFTWSSQVGLGYWITERYSASLFAHCTVPNVTQLGSLLVGTVREEERRRPDFDARVLLGVGVGISWWL